MGNRTSNLQKILGDYFRTEVGVFPTSSAFLVSFDTILTGIDALVNDSLVGTSMES